MRYSTSILAAIVISFFAFLGMSMLIATPKSYKASDFEMINFNLIENIDTPIKVKPVTTELPKQEKVKQPPAAPSIDISEDKSRDSISIPVGEGKIENMDIEGLNIPQLNNLLTGIGPLKEDGGLMQTLSIQPIYPQEAARAGIEGWVKVEITVNKYGLVSHAKVLESSHNRIFDRATLNAVKKSKFKPLMIDGIPYEQTAIQVIEFKLDNK